MSDYKTGYAQGVADAAVEIGQEYYLKDDRLDPYHKGWNDALDATGNRIRALSAPPSVTEEWVWDIATTKGRFKRVDCEEEFGAVIDTLASLGIEVTK